MFAGLDILKDRFYARIMERSAHKPPAAPFVTFQKLKQGRYPLCPIVHPSTFWRSIMTGDPYRVRALWMMGSNPLVNTTHSREVETALKSLAYVVVSDLFLTPTAQLADLVLLASMWLKQDDVVNDLKPWCVLARYKVAQVGETRDDRDVTIQLAHRLGLNQAFLWATYREFLDEMLAGTGLSFEQFCEQGMWGRCGMKIQRAETSGRDYGGSDVQMIVGTGKPPRQLITEADLTETIQILNDSGVQKVFLSARNTCGDALGQLAHVLDADVAVLKAADTYRV